MAKANLPAEVHAHFRKANTLHGYVEKSLGEATKFALEIGQELLAAKKAIPHGSWESECDRLFDGSSRTARFYMEFAKHWEAIPKRQRSAVLMLEGSLTGAAKLAKEAAAAASGKQPPKRKPPEKNVVDVEFDVIDSGEDADLAGTPEDSDSQGKEKPAAPGGGGAGAAPAPGGKEKPAEDLGKCPNCAGTKWDQDEDGVACAKCHHPHGEPAGETDEDRLKTQRQKTVKTIEAILRAFDDLQCMCARQEHDGATKWKAGDVTETISDMGVIAACKGLLALAKGWK